MTITAPPNQFQNDSPREPKNKPKRVAFIGQPNTGKSTLFNKITKAGAGVANWPGLTVDLMRAELNLNDQVVEFVDLPGIYDLDGFTDDEKVVQTFLETNAVDLVVVVLNAVQVDRQIRIPLQLKALGLPIIVILNMADEAKRFNVGIDLVKLQKNLNVPTHAISAKYGTGCDKAYESILSSLETVDQSVTIDSVVEYFKEHPTQQAELDQVIEGSINMPAVNITTLTNRIDRWLLHPGFGLPIFFATMFLVFWFIWSIGIPTADPVDELTGWFQESLLEPALSPFPSIVQDFVVEGPFSGIATVFSFVPLVALFFVVMTALEDSGYLSRAAYLIDVLMEKCGLDGRAFVLQLMGFGCNVPAVMGTRVMRSRAMRLLSMLIIPFSLCSARLQVFVFILAVILPGPSGAMALFSLYIMSFVVAYLIATIFNFTGQFKNEEPFVVELPPYRIPTAKQVFFNVWNEMKSFMTKVMMFMILGTTITWFLTNFPEGSAEGIDSYAGQLGSFFAPVMNPIGISPFLTVSLIIGFVAKEVQLAALATVYGLSNDALQAQLAMDLTFAQGFSYLLFSLLYIPCLTTLGTIFGESKSVKFTVFSATFSLCVAWVISFSFYNIFNLIF